MFRVNIAVTTPATITAGQGTPGGTNGVLFVNSGTNQLNLVKPDGTVWIAEVEIGTTNLRFVPAP